MRRANSNFLSSKFSKQSKDNFRPSVFGLNVTTINGDKTKIFRYSYNLTESPISDKNNQNSSGYMKAPFERTSKLSQILSKREQARSKTSDGKCEESVEKGPTHVEFQTFRKNNVEPLCETARNRAAKGNDSSTGIEQKDVSYNNTNSFDTKILESQLVYEAKNSFENKILEIENKEATGTYRNGLHEQMRNNQNRKSRKKGVCDVSDGSHYQRQFLRVLKKRF